MTITTLVLMMFCASCITLISCKLIAANIYNKTIEKYDPTPTKLLKSPYGISREKGSSGNVGYSITKNGNLLRTHGNSFVVYGNLSGALHDINMYETLEGYELTVLNNINED